MVRKIYYSYILSPDVIVEEDLDHPLRTKIHIPSKMWEQYIKNTLLPTSKEKRTKVIDWAGHKWAFSD